MSDAPTTATSLSLIDWWLVFTAGLWILGLSLVVAAFSYHRWLARENGRGLRQQFREPSWSVSFATGMTMMCAGFGLGRDVVWWERAMWLALMLSFGWQLAQAVSEMKRTRRATGDSDVLDKRPG